MYPDICLYTGNRHRYVIKFLCYNIHVSFMKFETIISHDFMIVASVLFLSAVFNKTLMNIIARYEDFATAADSDKMTAKSFMSQDTWMNFFKSKAFYFPNLWNMLFILALFVYLLYYVIKKSTKVPSAY